MTWYVVDGMDGSGKTTVADMLVAELRSRGRRVLLMNHPNVDTLVGRLEQGFLHGDSKLDVILSTMLYIADVLHSLSVMRGRKGREYDDVVFVRYSMAVAYLSDSACMKAHRAVELLLPTPDVAVLVDIDPRIAINRIFSRGDELEVFETLDKLTSIRNRMLGISEGWVVLNNGGDMESLRAQMNAEVKVGTDEAPRSHASI